VKTRPKSNFCHRGSDDIPMHFNISFSLRQKLNFLVLTDCSGRQYFPPMLQGQQYLLLHTRGGFSLLEIVLALALMAILAAIAMPSWNRLLPAYKLDSSARQVQSELYNIKMRAAAENVGFQLAYGDAASEYSIQREAKTLVTKPLPEGIVITKAGSISFSPRGTAGPNRVRLRNSSGLCKQIVVSATGRVRVCKPTDCGSDC
jgi:prepilin-type N-terminal cleavage/methylation domain-containing protein